MISTKKSLRQFIKNIVQERLEQTAGSESGIGQGKSLYRDNPTFYDIYGVDRAKGFFGPLYDLIGVGSAGQDLVGNFFGPNGILDPKAFLFPSVLPDGSGYEERRIFGAPLGGFGRSIYNTISGDVLPVQGRRGQGFLSHTRNAITGRTISLDEISRINLLQAGGKLVFEYNQEETIPEIEEEEIITDLTTVLEDEADETFEKEAVNESDIIRGLGEDLENIYVQYENMKASTTLPSAIDAYHNAIGSSGSASNLSRLLSDPRASGANLDEILALFKGDYAPAVIRQMLLRVASGISSPGKGSPMKNVSLETREIMVSKIQSFISLFN